jgi:hypothetical protein
MNLVLPIPDDIAASLGASGDVERLALEGFALESYRAGRLTKAQLRRMLGPERLDVDGFLKAHEVYDPITIEDVERDIRDLQSLRL